MFKRKWPLLFVMVLALTACAGAVSSTAVEAPVVKDKLTLLDFYSDECANCMVMQPIVDKLGKRYSDHITVKPLDIDAGGKSLFDSMGLRGNPIFLILKPDGTVIYKGYGRVPELALDKAIQKAIGLEGA